MCVPHRQATHASHRRRIVMQQAAKQRTSVSSISTHKLSKKHDKQDMYITRINKMFRNDNGAGFFGYPSHPTPNGTGFKFNKRVWDGYEIFFKPGAGLGIAPSRLHIKLILKLNLI